METCIATGFDAERIEISGGAQGCMVDLAPHRIRALLRDAAPSQQKATGGDMILEQIPTRKI